LTIPVISGQRPSGLETQRRDDRERGGLGHTGRHAKGLESARALRHVDAAIPVVIEERGVTLQRGVAGTAARLQRPSISMR
jgi:hypothetical protein